MNCNVEVNIFLHNKLAITKGPQMKTYQVTAAIIKNKTQILCMQRPKSKYDYISYKYEFPGGKVEEGESLSDCLSRELDEELEISHDVKEEHYFMTVNHEYPDFAIEMHAFIVEVSTRNFVRKEHIDHKWLEIEELNLLDWAPADVPIVERLMRGIR